MRGGVGAEVGEGGEGGTDRLDAIFEGETRRVGFGQKLGGGLSIVPNLSLRRFL